MQVGNFNVIGYNSSYTILTTQATEVKKSTGQTEYDGSRIDNLSLQSGKLVSFTNQDGNNVKVYIDNSTLDKLSSKFGSDSLAPTDNNTIKASGKAEEYLAGFWKVAQSNILSADKDKNGIIEGSEVLDVKVNPESGGDINVRNKTMNFSSDGFQSMNDNVFLSQDAKNSLAEQFGSTSVDTLFNQLLKYDKNSDGNIGVGEIVSINSMNNIYNEFANNENLALYEEITIGNKSIVYKEYMPSAKAVQESEKNKRAKQTQDALTDDDKQKTEDKKIEEIKATQETKTKEQTDNIDNNKQNVGVDAPDSTLAKNN
ncbi:MAG: hypothetical protein PHE67_03255 [Campylobacterales bacterium]|nr:hypothetical protein [Campylobacterales bacterium]